MPNEAHPSDRCYDMNWNKRYHSSYSIQINKCMGESLQWQTGLWIINVYGNAVDHLSTHFIFFLCFVPCSHSAHRSMLSTSWIHIFGTAFIHVFTVCLYVSKENCCSITTNENDTEREKKSTWIWFKCSGCDYWDGVVSLQKKNEESKKSVCIENPSKH